jgi:hypothetical protein
VNETAGIEPVAKTNVDELGNGARDSIPNTRTIPRRDPPIFQLVSLEKIELDPRLSSVYQQKDLHFPPEIPPEFLTDSGIRMAARLLPIHGVAHDGKVQCFAGVRLWLAALSTLPLGSKIEVLVYQSFEQDRLPSIVEMEEDILYIWYRQAANARKAAEHRYLNSKRSSALRLNFEGKDQEKWKNILKISLKTLQNRLTSHRSKA